MCVWTTKPCAASWASPNIIYTSFLLPHVHTLHKRKPRQDQENWLPRICCFALQRTRVKIFCYWGRLITQNTQAQPNLRTNSCRRLRSRIGIVTATVSCWLSSTVDSNSYCVGADNRTFAGSPIACSIFTANSVYILYSLLHVNIGKVSLSFIDKRCKDRCRSLHRLLFRLG